jgi:hypothetical protein
MDGAGDAAGVEPTPGARMRFAPGEVLVRRSWRGGRISIMNVLRVVADDQQGLRLWLPVGSPYWRLVGADGRTHRDAAIDELPGAELTQFVWTGSDVMMWLPPARPYSVWWLWTDGVFEHWYANMEEPYVRWADRGCAGVDTADYALDLIVRPDLSWRWKDEDEFYARTGHPLYWTEAQASQIKATGDRLVKLAETGEFPFDGTWCGYRPDASWTMPGLPAGHNRPRATASRP